MCYSINIYKRQCVPIKTYLPIIFNQPSTHNAIFVYVVGS